VHAKITQAPVKLVLAAVYKRRPQSVGRGLSSARVWGPSAEKFSGGKRKKQGWKIAPLSSPTL